MASAPRIRFEWNERNAETNLRKHKVSFELAPRVFDDEFAQTELEGTEHGEARFRTTGQIGGILIVVSHTYREEAGIEIIRIVSARKATRSERRHFEEST
jgi:uncharacterized DUF497 family protein